MMELEGGFGISAKVEKIASDILVDILFMMKF
jgi:hypothetical protein